MLSHAVPSLTNAVPCASPALARLARAFYGVVGHFEIHPGHFDSLFINTIGVLFMNYWRKETEENIFFLFFMNFPVFIHLKIHRKINIYRNRYYNISKKSLRKDLSNEYKFAGFRRVTKE